MYQFEFDFDSNSLTTTIFANGMLRPLLWNVYQNDIF